MLNKKNKLNFVLAVSLILYSLLTFGQSENIVLNEFITSWNLLGPLPLEKSTNELKHNPGFEKDFLSKYGGEKDPKIKVGKTIKVGNNKLKWVDYT